METRAPFRVGTVDCVVDKLFVSNNNFTCIKNPQYWVDGQLQFPPGEEKWDGTYRTMFGPGPSHNGLIYAANDHNLSLAIRRLTACRQPETPGFHQLLRDNQTSFIAKHKPVFALLRHFYTPYFNTWTDHCTEAAGHYDDPHIKRALRITAWNDLVERGLQFELRHTWLLKKAVWKLKTNEWGKIGKYGRTIVDLASRIVAMSFCEPRS